MKIGPWILLLLFVHSIPSEAQRKGYFSGSVHSGIMYYQGDLSGGIFPDLRTTHLAIGIDLGYKPNSLFNFNIGYTRGKISAADSLVAGHEVRNFHFYSVINDFRFLMSIDLMTIYRHYFPSKTLSRADWKPSFAGPELILGVGYLNFNPMAKKGSTEYSLRYLGTEGQYIDREDDFEPYNLWQFNMKYGVGFGYNATRQISISLQIIYNQVFTDYLDDVSGNYPSYNKLMNSARGVEASYFTYGGRDGSNISPSTRRGNPDKNDGFVTACFKFTYTFGRMEFKRIINL